MMTIGQRLRRAIENSGLTQKEVAARAGLEQASVSEILNDRTSPRFVTVERMVAAIGISFAELFDEPRISLSEKDIEILSMATALNQRLLANDAAQKELREPGTSAPRRGASVLRDSGAARAHPADEALGLPHEQISERYVRQGARRAFRVTTDAMIGAGILEGEVIYVRPTVDLPHAEGEIIVCRLNGALKVKRLELRGDKVTLANANPRYSDLVVTEADTFSMIGVVITGGK